MDVTFSDSRRVAVVTLRGELRRTDEAPLRQALVRAEESLVLVVVDLGGVTYLDTALAGMLVAAAARAMSRGRRLVVAQAHDQPLLTLAQIGASYLLTSVRDRGHPSLLDL